jgi:hypothetical protein
MLRQPRDRQPVGGNETDEPRERRPVFNVFIDTQAVHQQAFGFRESVGLLALANAVNDRRVRVLLTEVTDREIKSHIRDLVTKGLQQVKKQYVLQVLTNISFDEWRKLDEVAAVKNALDEWEAYKTRIKAALVSVNLVKPTAVMDAYFDKRPPFSGKKPNEFRDAFVLYALRSWAEKRRQSVIVVSGDGDHSDFCDAKVLVHATTILEALALTFDDKAKLRTARQRLKAQRATLVEQLKDKVSRLPITIDDDYEADVEDLRVKRVEFDAEAFELAEVRDGHVLLAGPIRISAEIDATVAAYESGAREDGEWAYVPYNEVTYLPDLEAHLAIRMPHTLSSIGPIDDVIIEKPKSIELASHTCEVRMRKHWSEGDEPGDDELEQPTQPARNEPENLAPARRRATTSARKRTQHRKLLK